MKITGIELAIVVLGVLALFGWMIWKHDKLDKAQLAREQREREEAELAARIQAEADRRRDHWNRAQAERTARRNAGLPVETTYELYLDAVREEASARTMPTLEDLASMPKGRRI